MGIITKNTTSGLIVKSENTGDNKPVYLTIQTGETTIVADEVIGEVNFQVPDEASGTDSLLVAAGISAVAEDTFASDANATKLSFKTAASEAAVEKMALSSTGTLKLKETSAAVADTAGMGQLWVKNSTPCELYFTTDAGTDIQLTDGTSTAPASVSGDTFATDLKIGRDAHNLIDFSTDDAVTFRVANADEITLAANEFSPTTSDGIALGTTSKMWSDLFLASGAVVNFNNGDMTLTHSSSTLTVGGGTLAGAAITASGDITVGDDLILDSDSCVLSFGDDADVKFTHYHDNGLLLNATRKIYFEDGTNWDQYIGSAGSGVLAIASVTEIDLTAPTVDINASTNVDISATLSVGGAVTLSTIAEVGSDVDKFLCSDSGVIKYVDGANLATYIGAVSTSAASTFTAKQQIDLAAANITPAADGSHLHIEGGVNMTDNNTSGSGTAAAYSQVSIEAITLLASNSSVTTTNAATLYISGPPAAGTNQTITNAHAIWAKGPLTIGVDDTGHDVKFYGATSGQYMLWDESADELVLAGDSKLSFHDAAGGENIIASADGHLEINSGTTLDMTAPTVDINASTAVTIDTDTVTIGSANANDPLVTIKNTTNDADGARLRFVKDKGAAGAANDVAGLIEFYADDANQDQVLFSEIKSQVAVHTNGQEGGKLTLSVASHDGESQPGLVITDGSAEDEVDVTIGNGSDSLTTIAGDLDIPNGGFALGSDADGDIYYRNSGNLQRLAKGDDDQVLTLSSGLPTWAAAGGGSSSDRYSISNRFRAGALGSTSNVYFTDDVDTSGNQFYVSKSATHGSTINVDSDWLSGFEGGPQWQAPRNVTLTQITATSRVNANSGCHSVRVCVFKATPVNNNTFSTDITWTQIGTADLTNDGSTQLTDYALQTINTAISSGNSISAGDCVIIGFQPIGGTTAATSYFQVSLEFTVA